jgi:hypothetical protein
LLSVHFDFIGFFLSDIKAAIARATLIPDPSYPLKQHLLGSKTHLRAEPLTGLGRFSRTAGEGSFIALHVWLEVLILFPQAGKATEPARTFAF